MKIQLLNTSFRNTKDFNHLIDFVSCHFPTLTPSKIFVTCLNRKRIEGLASSFSNSVTLKLPIRKYPYISKYIKTLPGKKIRNWEEEFILVLAHEFGHLLQFKNQVELTEWEAEVDAELQGYRVLDAWVKFKKCLTNFIGSPIVES